MGADTFETHATGRTPQEAYQTAREEARDRNGHRDGYSGDIQTTSGFVMVPVTIKPRSRSAARRKAVYDAINTIINDGANQFGIAKWEACGCIELPREKGMKRGHRLFLFFGWGAC